MAHPARSGVLALAVLASCLGPPRQTFEVGRLTEPAAIVASNAEADEDPAVIRTSDGRFRVVWWAKRNGQVDLYTRVSDDGTTWSDEHAITADRDEDYYPSLVQAHDGTLHVAWFRYDRRRFRKTIWYTRSLDGRTWTPPMQISGAGLDWAPDIYEDRSGMLWIVWSSERTGNRELYTVRSGDGGRTWSHPARLTSSREEDDFPYVLVRPSGERVMVWTRYREGAKADRYYSEPSSIVMATSNDGLQWSAPRLVSPPDPDARYVDFLPCVFADAGDHHEYVTWTSNRPGRRGDILVTALDAPSASIRQLTTSSASDYGAHVVRTATPGDYLMVWTSGEGGGMHVYARRFSP